MRPRDIKIGHRLALAFCLILFLMAGVTAISVLASRGARQDLAVAVHGATSKTTALAAMRQSLFRQLLLGRSIGASNDVVQMPKDMAVIEGEAAGYKKSEATFEAAGLDADERAILDRTREYERTISPFVQEAKEAVDGFNGIVATRALTAKAAPVQEKWLLALDDLVALQTRHVASNMDTFEGELDRANGIMMAICGGAMLLAAGIGYTLNRSITKPLNDAVGLAQRVARGDLSVVPGECNRDETGQMLEALYDMNKSLVGIVDSVRTSADTIGEASREIADGNLDLSQRTEAQAAALEQTASAMTDLTGQVRRNSEYARQADACMASALERARTGGEVVFDVVNTMNDISSSSKKIVDIIGVIDSIAFQTNILALNAAVEAARAGEQGRGFAVVASEVRTLAQRSANAAKEIKALIGASVQSVDAGSALVGRAGTAMTEIVSSINQVAEMVAHISSSSAEQSAGIEGMGRAVRQMDEMTQQNAALVEEASAAAQTMRHQAQQLVETVSVFILDEDQEGRQGRQGNRPRLQAPPVRKRLAS